MRWKPALNAFAVTFADRMPPAETCLHRYPYVSPQQGIRKTLEFDCPNEGSPPGAPTELIAWIFPSSQALVRMDRVRDTHRLGKQPPILLSRGHGVDHHLFAALKNEDDGLQ